MLYPELFRQLESVRWDMDKDIPWQSFDASRLSEEQAQTIKMNAITEWAALPATEMFLRDNRHDSDFSAFMSIWFFEEQKHSLVLMEYLKRFSPQHAPTEQELHDVRFDFDPAPPLETLMLHFCGEIRLNHWYRRAAEWHTEPVIKHIYTTLSQDEARHGGAYLRYMKRAMEKFGDEARSAFTKVGVLMASARRTAQALHPTNLHVNKALFPNDTDPEPRARSRLARALARQADQVRRRLGKQGRRAHPAQPEPADEPELQDRAGAEPVPQGAGGLPGPQARIPGRGAGARPRLARHFVPGAPTGGSTGGRQAGSAVFRGLGRREWGGWGRVGGGRLRRAATAPREGVSAYWGDKTLSGVRRSPAPAAGRCGLARPCRGPGRAMRRGRPAAGACRAR